MKVRNKIIFEVFIALTVLSFYWYAFVTLKEVSIPQEDIIAAYTYALQSYYKLNFLPL